MVSLTGVPASVLLIFGSAHSHEQMDLLLERICYHCMINKKSGGNSEQPETASIDEASLQ